MEIFKNWYIKRHEYVKEWKKETGGRVVGYFCTYVPEEILYAAGILPVRIFGAHGPQNISEPHIFSMFCPFCRDCLSEGLHGRYEYLDGIMIAQSCLHIRQTFTSWNLHKPTDFSYFLPMPHNVRSRHAVEFLCSEYEILIGNLEKWTGRKISENDLKNGIAAVNRFRMLMRSVYEMRKNKDVPVTGIESIYMVLSGQTIDKRNHVSGLEKTIGEIKDRSCGKRDAIRLMLIGSENDNTGLIEMIEGLDAVIVQDEQCTGSRYFWDNVEYDSNPVRAIAKRYVERLPCPSKDWPERKRVKRIIQFAKDWNVAGAVIIQQKFCDPHELDMPSIRKALENAGIKVLFLESDITIPVEQLKIRVEAFLEMLSDEDLF